MTKKKLFLPTVPLTDQVAKEELLGTFPPEVRTVIQRTIREELTRPHPIDGIEVHTESIGSVTVQACWECPLRQQLDGRFWCHHPGFAGPEIIPRENESSGIPRWCFLRLIHLEIALEPKEDE